MKIDDDLANRKNTPIPTHPELLEGRLPLDHPIEHHFLPLSLFWLLNTAAATTGIALDRRRQGKQPEEVDSDWQRAPLKGDAQSGEMVGQR